MWPNLWGPGWEWGILTSLGLFGGLVALLLFLSWASRTRTSRPDPVQALQVLWMRYEQGDLTPWEFQRLKQAWFTEENRSRPHASPRPRGRKRHGRSGAPAAARRARPARAVLSNSRNLTYPPLA
jgi:hypothetical protein